MMRAWYALPVACVAAVLGICAWEAADYGAPAACAVVSLLAFAFAVIAVGMWVDGE